MKKAFRRPALLCAVVMIGLPYLAVKFVRGDAGMAVCFLLFFAVDPLTSVFIGIAAGRELRGRRFWPLLSPVLFLLGVWILFDPGETAFLLYAGAYLLLGFASMLLSAWIRRRRA